MLMEAYEQMVFDQAGRIVHQCKLHYDDYDRIINGWLKIWGIEPDETLMADLKKLCLDHDIIGQFEDYRGFTIPNQAFIEVVKDLIRPAYEKFCEVMWHEGDRDESH